MLLQIASFLLLAAFPQDSAYKVGGMKGALARPGEKLPDPPVFWRNHSIDFFLKSAVSSFVLFTLYLYDKILEELTGRKSYLGSYFRGFSPWSRGFIVLRKGVMVGGCGRAKPCTPPQWSAKKGS